LSEEGPREGLEIGALLLCRPQRVDRRHDGIEGGELLVQLGAGRLVDAGVELGLDRVPAADQLVQLDFGDCAHSRGGMIVTGIAGRSWTGDVSYSVSVKYGYAVDARRI
jgi:hypothetical protein